MKSTRVIVHDSFHETPISRWAGARWIGWITQTSESGQPKRPKMVTHPFLEQRKQWCTLNVQFEGIDLWFAMPEELDQFLNVMSKNPLPSGHSLVSGTKIGRPNRHWLARLPAKAKSQKFRKRLCAYLIGNRDVTQFREYYLNNPVLFNFPDVHDVYSEAHQASFDGTYE